MAHKFPYKWNLSDGYPAKGIEQHKKTVFGTFICGGGSTMGYKLAGFEHLGGVEIDPKISAVYKANHNPKYLYTEDIRDFVKRSEYPEELYDLDILDGSPPCSSFSMAGNREKDWGKEKKFAEGQAVQTLDDLFFDYIALAKKLQPKIVIAENVKGLIQGNAKSYVRKIKTAYEEAGYKVQLFLLNAASMGVPQKRERVFFVCQRNDLNFPKLVLNFHEEAILFGEIKDPQNTDCNISGKSLSGWNTAKQGEPIGIYSSDTKVSDKKVSPTIRTGGGIYNSTIPRTLSKEELSLIGSYPMDYNFCETAPKWIIGMSVPPVMTAQIAHEIYRQWLQ